MTREQTYYLPLHVIIEMMQGLRKTVALGAPVSAVPGLLRQECRAILVVGEQGVLRCVIAELQSGQVLCVAQEALNLLQRYNRLVWRLLPPQVVLGTYQSSGGAGRIPRRSVNLTPAQVQSFSHAYRRVLALLDGQHTTERIAHLLTKTPDEVERILADLKEHGLITIE